MNSGIVIGKTYSKFMHPSMEGKSIKIIQPVSVEDQEPLGKPFFAVDPIGVAIGELVAWEESFQATWAYEDHDIPIDKAVIAIIDSLDIEKKEEDKNDNG